MIKFTELKWSNAFSYGPDNSIRLDSTNLTQLLGSNGNGKSSIALILEEGLFNTNSKKIKKADVLNRYVKAKSYNIEVSFEKDGAPYTVTTSRTVSTGTVKLFKNSVDISSHTSTGTYKQIEYILGFDHKTFSQIVYQSSVSSLEFLTATDSARKKFLIELLNLSKYTKALDVFKELSSDCSKQLDILNSKIQTINGWIHKYSSVDTTIKEYLDEPKSADNPKIQLSQALDKLANIDSTNKQIQQNNTYKSILEGIDISLVVEAPTSSNIAELRVELATVLKQLKDGAQLSNKPSAKTIKCPTCSQDMDNSVMFSRVVAFEALKPNLLVERAVLENRIANIEADIIKYSEYTKKLQEWEKYHALYNPKLSRVLLDKATLASEVATLREQISTIDGNISRVRHANKLIGEHNSKAKVVSEQMVDMKKDLLELNQELVLKIDELSNLQVLVKTFSNTGLIAFKIECMVKDLEELTNEYLSVMSDGRFQLSFVVVSDKLNVVITDNNNDIDIVALSSGERARVNVSTLLAIRKLMQALSNSRTNLLILDETISNLDSEGKEKLIEVLLEEKDLNTFIVSHDFSHPLLEKLSVIKEHNISRIE